MFIKEIYFLFYSVTANAGARANVDTHCSLDYLLVIWLLIFIKLWSLESWEWYGLIVLFVILQIPGGFTEEFAQEGSELTTCDSQDANRDMCKYTFFLKTSKQDKILHSMILRNITF